MDFISKGCQSEWIYKSVDFNEDQWDTIIPEQIEQLYAVLLREQNLSEQQAHFENANDAPRTAVPMRCKTRNADASSIVHTANENLPTDSNKGTQNKKSSDSNHYQDGHTHGKDNADNTNKESNNHDPCNDEACNAACQDAYAYGYAVGHAASSSLNFTNGHGGDCNHATNLVSDDKDKSIDDKYDDEGNFDDAYDNDYAGQEDY